MTTSEIWNSFRKYENDKRDEYAVCLICKNDRKKNADAEVKYGASHSTSKLEQHLKSRHEEVHKRKIDEAVEEQRKKGFFLLNSLHVVPGIAAVDNFIEWIALSSQPISTCEDPYFRTMVSSLNSKSPLATLSYKTVKEKVVALYTIILQYVYALRITLK